MKDSGLIFKLNFAGLDLQATRASVTLSEFYLQPQVDQIKFCWHSVTVLAVCWYWLTEKFDA